jgi:hypothetical protein
MPETRMFAHLFILTLVVIIFNLTELITNGFKDCEWYVPSIAGFAVFICCDFLFIVAHYFIFHQGLTS